tara:strand:+ start:2509 stop:2670 length:162 start_codon:yes stop_codon:yes gene_type:complete
MIEKEKTEKQKYEDGTYFKLFKEILNHFPSPDQWEEVLQKPEILSPNKPNKKK